MTQPTAATPLRTTVSIWAYAFGYFACYAPYSALTKLVSSGRLPGVHRAVDGFELLPLTTIVSLVAMVAVLTALRWWRFAGRRSVFRIEVIAPSRWTFLSGLATAAIMASTTLAYTFSGVSIVFMMLIMRGGVLAIAPIVDAASKRRVQPSSWMALGFSVLGLLVTLGGGASYELTIVASVDVAVYLAAYFVRLRLMSHVAKSEDRATSIRYFVEEQMIASPATLLVLGALAVVGRGPMMLAVRAGFAMLAGTGAFEAAVAVGTLSFGTGIFGALILLGGQENAFCVPVNRANRSRCARYGADPYCSSPSPSSPPPRSVARGSARQAASCRRARRSDTGATGRPVERPSPDLPQELLSTQEREAVLVVEDDRAIRESLAGLLRDEGLEVLEASSLGLARRLLASSRIGVVVLDLTLADGDAEAFIEELDGIELAPALVLCSADALRADEVGRRYGIPHLRKPVDLALAHATISVALERRIRPRSRDASGRRPRTER